MGTNKLTDVTQTGCGDAITWQREYDSTGTVEKWVLKNGTVEVYRNGEKVADRNLTNAIMALED